MLNKAILMGRLTADPELKHTPENTPVTSFTLRWSGAMARRNFWLKRIKKGRKP